MNNESHKRRVDTLVRRPKAAHVMVQEIIDMIAEGELEPGEFLGSEADLITRFGFSRAVVREALRLLEHDGAVTVKPGPSGGIFCTSPGVIQLTRSLDLFGRLNDVTSANINEARLELEVVSAHLAAVRRTEDDLKTLEVLNSRWIEEIGYRDRHAAAQVNVDFHLALAKAAHNPIFEAMMEALEGLLYENALEPWYPKRRSGSADEAFSHDSILKAVRDRDPEKAGKLMRQHLILYRPRAGKGWMADGTSGQK